MIIKQGEALTVVGRLYELIDGVKTPVEDLTGFYFTLSIQDGTWEVLRRDATLEPGFFYFAVSPLETAALNKKCYTYELGMRVGESAPVIVRNKGGLQVIPSTLGVEMAREYDGAQTVELPNATVDIPAGATQYIMEVGSQNDLVTRDEWDNIADVTSFYVLLVKGDTGDTGAQGEPGPISSALPQFVKRYSVMNAYHSFRYGDVMPQTANYNAPTTKIGRFTPIASTETSLTFSSEDAVCLDKQICLVCKLNTNAYAFVEMTASSENVCTKIYDYGAGVDMRNVVDTMALHDTIQGGNGQHLSPWGYKAMAQAIVDQSKTSNMLLSECVSGWVGISSMLADDYRDLRVRNLEGVELCTVTTNELWKTGGNTGIYNPIEGKNPANASQLANLSINKDWGLWSNRAYNIVQGGAGAQINFAFDLLRPITGVAKIAISNVQDKGYDGSITLTMTEGDVTVYTNSNIVYGDILYIPIVGVTNPVISVMINEAKNTRVIISQITFYENYSDNYKPITDNSVVAMLGSSNTQYPPSNASYIGIVEGDPYNEIVVRPNGTTGDGYGYFAKEIATYSGATVDNWGKSGEPTTYGLDLIHEIFTKKRYTHVVLTLFGNDINADVPFSEIIDNIWEMCEYIKGHGAIPIIVCGYGTASSTQLVDYGKFHDILQLTVANNSYVE